MNGNVLWFVSRATGLVALPLLTLTFVLGILGPLRVGERRRQRFVVAGLHRNASLLAVGLVAVHVASTILDGYVHLGWADVVVPGIAGYRTFWTALGTLALDLMLLLIGTSLLRPRIPYRLWRAVHWAAYACWPLAEVHGLGVGTDSRAGWPLLLALGCLVAALTAAVVRLLSASSARPASGLTSPSTAPSVPAGVPVPPARAVPTTREVRP
ncbi:Ferric reductase like transmembrane component [Actinopolymorpha cephalotaxi]|uniref:Ferric reductase n=1 Tax=Actinopolymorpha cephalotaxi TaxID=504797 RepID=A0A1I2TCM4_9ACTN|nr:ferric reductase-like transmembrane domain-containing protein [Actinopolymorpha cephalotaxi]NYH82948.1 putative ferric reductase [Actinopolymorpha cephalotaxi]SFG60346.1 Ferric reductase like transmembrane component [Actinopolymorpha cephalotaxi]